MLLLHPDPRARSCHAPDVVAPVVVQLAMPVAAEESSPRGFFTRLGRPEMVVPSVLVG